MNTSDRRAYGRHMAMLAVTALVAWATFLASFRAFWPEGYEPGGDRGTFFAWLGVGTIAVVLAFHVAFRLLRTPRRWRASAAIALSAPAFCLDAVATTFFHDWFPAAGPADDAAYAALILGSVGVALLTVLVFSPDDGTPGAVA